MSKGSLRSAAVFLFALIVVEPAAIPAAAIEPFGEGFKAKYVNRKSKEPQDVAFRKAVDKAGCTVCHVAQGRDERNVYGKALGRWLDHESDAKNKEKIEEVLDRVANMRSNPNISRSPTFGDLIEQGKLPAANQESDP